MRYVILAVLLIGCGDVLGPAPADGGEAPIDLARCPPTERRSCTVATFAVCGYICADGG